MIVNSATQTNKIVKVPAVGPVFFSWFQMILPIVFQDGARDAHRTQIVAGLHLAGLVLALTTKYCTAHVRFS